jgi:hypothetical protein
MKLSNRSGAEPGLFFVVPLIITSTPPPDRGVELAATTFILPALKPPAKLFESKLKDPEIDPALSAPSSVMTVVSQVTTNSNAVIFKPVVDPMLTGIFMEVPGGTETAGNVTDTCCAKSIPQHATINTTIPNILFRELFKVDSMDPPPYDFIVGLLCQFANIY